MQHKKKIIADANKKNNQDINLLKESIMDYMKSKGFNEVFHKNGKLKLTTSKRTSAITKDILRDSFTEYLKSEKKTDELFDLINSKRSIIESESLRQLKN